MYLLKKTILDNDIEQLNLTHFPIYILKRKTTFKKTIRTTCIHT